ncbi:NAD(P)H-binding protein [Sphingomonas oleivorans]|nr:NAD(P)H-binding protein [Sphingomonas oleivorans]
MTFSSMRTALVLGATGGIGGVMAEALLARGWHVRAMVRDPIKAADRWRDRPARPEWIIGDAMVEADVVRAAEGAGTIIHAVNPLAYRGWGRLVLPMIDNSIAAAARAGSRIMLPGTIYNFDPASQTLLHEDMLQHPTTKKGAIRVALERRLEQASARGVSSLIVRSGDYFGPRAGQGWFNQLLVQPGRPVRRIIHPGAAGIGHGWAYLPDLAEAVVRLIEAEERLRSFERVHFAGHWDADGHAIADAVKRVVGRPDIPVHRFPWWLTGLAAPFSETMREMREIRRFWRSPMRLDNSRMVALLGAEPHTPLDIAIRDTLAGMGCLDEIVAPGRAYPSTSIG